MQTLRWLLLVLCAGCVRIPENEGRCALMPTPSVNVQDALHNGPFVSGDFPACSWWEEWDDPQLDELIAIALADNPSLKQAEARLQTAEQDAKIKRASLFPMLGLGGEANLQHLAKNGFFRAFAPSIPAGVNEYTLELNFSYEFDFWGKNRNIFQAALGLSKAAEAEAAGVRLIISTAVAAAYFQYQADLQKFTLAKNQYELTKKRSRLTQLRSGGALDDNTALFDADATLLLQQKLLLLAEQSLLIDEHELNMLLGRGPDCPLDLEAHPLPSRATVALPTQLSCDLLARRPDLSAQIHRVEAAAHLIGAAKADFYPSVDLMALAGLDTVFIRRIFTWNSVAAVAAPAFNLPIFTAGRLRAQLRQKEALFQEAVEGYNTLLLQAVREVADQIVLLQKADEQLIVQESVLRKREETNALAKRRFEVGLRGAFDPIDAELALLNQEWGLIDQAFIRTYSALKLIQALGGGFNG